MIRPATIGPEEARRDAARQADERLWTALQSQDWSEHWPRHGHTAFDLPDDFDEDICAAAELEHQRRRVRRLLRRGFVALGILGLAVVAGHGLLLAWRL